MVWGGYCVNGSCSRVIRRYGGVGSRGIARVVCGVVGGIEWIVCVYWGDTPHSPPCVWGGRRYSVCMCGGCAWYVI